MTSHPTSPSSRRRGKANAAPALAKLREVAESAGVSTATVSRALNHPELVAPATLKRVEEAVAALAYVPNPAARALSHGRSRLIGALIPTIGYSIYAHYMEAVQSACSAAGYTLVLGVYQFDAQEEANQARRLVDAGVEGLLLVGFNHERALFDAIASRNLPYVCTSVHQSRSVHPNVGYDNFKAGKQIAQYLLSLGHRRFGVITGDTGKNDRMAQRLVGIRAALRSHGLDLTSDAVHEGGYSLVDGRVGFTRIFGGLQPTALVCGNDVIALGALQQARDDGVAVPDDVSIIGFDGLDWVAQFSPALTTISVPMTRMGERAAAVLIARIQGQAAPHSVDIPFELLERATCGKPPGAASRAAGV